MVHGLARDSRTRRLLILRQSTQTEGPTVHPRLAALRKILASEESATWVFSGEDGGPVHPEHLSLSGLFETEVRDARRRHDDIIVDSCKPRDRLVTLYMNLRPRVLRFEATAAFLQLGAGDPRPARVRQETQALVRICQALMEHGTTPVLLPPPAYLSGDAEAIARQRRRVVHVANQLFVPSIDIGSCRRPSDAGRVVLTELGLDVDCDVRPLPAEEVRSMLAKAKTVAASNIRGV